MQSYASYSVVWSLLSRNYILRISLQFIVVYRCICLPTELLLLILDHGFVRKYDIPKFDGLSQKLAQAARKALDCMRRFKICITESSSYHRVADRQQQGRREASEVVANGRKMLKGTCYDEVPRGQWRTCRLKLGLVGQVHLCKIRSSSAARKVLLGSAERARRGLGL